MVKKQNMLINMFTKQTNPGKKYVTVIHGQKYIYDFNKYGQETCDLIWKKKT